MKPSLLVFVLLFLCGTTEAAPLSQNEQQQAQRLFAALGCRGCHDFEKSHSNLANSLDRIGLQLNEEQIRQRLQRPPAKVGAGDKFMPSYQTTPLEQLKLLSRFLAGRK